MEFQLLTDWDGISQREYKSTVLMFSPFTSEILLSPRLYRPSTISLPGPADIAAPNPICNPKSTLFVLPKASFTLLLCPKRKPIEGPAFTYTGPKLYFNSTGISR